MIAMRSTQHPASKSCDIQRPRYKACVLQAVGLDACAMDNVQAMRLKHAASFEHRTQEA